MTEEASAPGSPAPGGQWAGHPKGVFYLSFAELWERFCFYGMRNILVLYMVHYFAYSDHEAQAGVYAAYTALVYCAAIFGGFAADRLIGYRRSIVLGGSQMAIGMALLLANNEVLGHVGMDLTRAQEEACFFGGMALMIVGNGFFKPNISTLVGKLYPAGDPRRDGGFTLFYMGINLGSLIGGTICAEIGQRYGWTLGFGLAAAGMLVGLFTFRSRRCEETLRHVGDGPEAEQARRRFPWVAIGSLAILPICFFLLQHARAVGVLLGTLGFVMLGVLLNVARKEERTAREQIFALCALLIFNFVFWAVFEQAGSSLTLFADRFLDREIFGFEIASGTVQNLNALFIIALAPVFAWLWVALGRRGANPSIPAKFGFALVQVALGFFILVFATRNVSSEGLAPLWSMGGLYLLFTTGELCLSPVGLSMVTKLAPVRMTGMVMGVWFLSIACANFAAGQIAASTGDDASAAAAPGGVETFLGVYQNLAWFLLAAAAVLFVLVPRLRRWMHGVT